MIATWCVRAALPLLFCLGDGALARRGERGPALPAGEAAVPALGPAELQWCIAREARIDQEQQAVETAAAALREQAAQVLQARQETLAMEMRGRADRDHGIRSMRPSLGEMLRRDLREREELLERDTARGQERATALAGVIAEYDGRCAGRSDRGSDRRALQSPIGR